MAVETGAREDGNEELVEKDMETEPSLTEIKGILHDIQQSISSILKDNIIQRRRGTPKVRI